MGYFSLSLFPFLSKFGVDGHPNMKRHTQDRYSSSYRPGAGRSDGEHWATFWILLVTSRGAGFWEPLPSLLAGIFYSSFVAVLVLVLYTAAKACVSLLPAGLLQ